MFKSKTSVAALSIFSNTSLIIIKVIVGWFSGSVSILSEAIHSAVDLLAAIIAFIAVKTSGKPADENHPFGHGKIENISGAIEALLIFIAAGWIIFEAIHKLIAPQGLEQLHWGMLVMGISAGVNLIVSGMLFKVGKATDSMALQADAWHLRTDVWTSAGVAAGLGLIVLGETFFPKGNWHWVDPMAAIIVALMIIRAAFELTLQAGRDLLDEKLSAEEEKLIQNAILSFCPTICGFHRMRTRKSGHFRFVEFHVQVDGSMSVDEAHRLTNLITDKIQQHFHSASVTIHIEPCTGFCSEICLTGCLLDANRRQAMQAIHQASLNQIKAQEP